MNALDGLSNPMSRRVRLSGWWRRLRTSLTYAMFGALLPFAGLVAFFLVGAVLK